MARRNPVSLRWIMALLCLAGGGAVLLPIALLGSGGTAFLWGGLAGILVASLLGYLAGMVLVKRLDGLRDRILNRERIGDRSGQPSSIEEFEELLAAHEQSRAAIERVYVSQKEFTINASHELRTPLAALRLAGESALRQASDADGLRESIEQMLEEASRLNRLVDQLLALARAESGHTPVQADYVSLSPFLEGILEALEPLAESLGHTIAFDLEENWSVWADPDLLRLALENLLSNALYHTPAGTPIDWVVRRNPSGGVEIEIRDHGPGIPPEDQERIFQRFWRGPGAPEGGAGLGLPLARWAIEAFGGRLQMESHEGRGSTFRLICPETGPDMLPAHQRPSSKG